MSDLLCLDKNTTFFFLFFYWGTSRLNVFKCVGSISNGFLYVLEAWLDKSVYLFGCLRGTLVVFLVAIFVSFETISYPEKKEQIQGYVFSNTKISGDHFFTIFANEIWKQQPEIVLSKLSRKTPNAFMRNGSGYPKTFCFSLSRASEISRQYLLLLTVILREKSRWVPLLYLSVWVALFNEWNEPKKAT